ncbi:hypothetical protein ACFFLM_02485 [Deinococcus oregonensis]|uniref:Uncharacterized protein n=1 Tax=Deinococcus oregonensis TaxID=1805970 RepID=A0ABV6ATM4_9DEIO
MSLQEQQRQVAPLRRLVWLPPGTCQIHAAPAASSDEPWMQSDPHRSAAPPLWLTQVCGGRVAMGVCGQTLYLSPLRPGLRPTWRDELQAQALGWTGVLPDPPRAGAAEPREW